MQKCQHLNKQNNDKFRTGTKWHAECVPNCAWQMGANSVALSNLKASCPSAVVTRLVVEHGLGHLQLGFALKFGDRKSFDRIFREHSLRRICSSGFRASIFCRHFCSSTWWRWPSPCPSTWERLLHTNRSEIAPAHLLGGDGVHDEMASGDELNLMTHG